VEERRAAVLAAREEHGWSVYRIAKTLQVDESTVRAILRAALARK
jgi:DNA-directed RNA polymerase specialized sigma24 family protein